MRVASVLAALLGSLLFLFLVAPIAQLVATAGVEGGARLATDAELRRALVLTAATATAAMFLGVLGGTPIAYVVERWRFRGRAIIAALLDLPLLIPHPVAGIALLLVLGRESVVGGAALQL